MKRILLALFLCIPFVASSMKIAKDEIDEFTGNRTLITSWEGICANNIHVRFRLQNGLELLDFKLVENDAIVIGEGDKLMLKSTADNIGEFSSIGIYRGERGGGAVGINGSGNWGIMATYQGDLDYFTDNVVRLARVYTSDRYIDKKVSEGDGKKIQKLYDLFSTALGGQPGVASSYANYVITFLKSTDGGKSWEVDREEYKKDLSKDELSEIVSEWKAQSKDRKLFDCRIKKDK